MGLEEIQKLKAFGYLKKESPVIKPKKGMAKRGEKMKAVVEILKKLYPLYLKKRPLCEIKSENCTQAATCVHHSEGRGPNEILDQSTWIPSCEPCNLWCETNDAEAREKGFKKQRIK